MRDTFLPFAQPDLGAAEFSAVESVLASGWLTTGPKVRQFEAEFAAYVGAKHAIAVNSATAALHLALEAIGLKRGDEVITTPYTFAATAEVVRYFDAHPVFVDVDSRDFNLRADLLSAAITPRTRAIVPVHIAGLAADMDPIRDVATRYNLPIIEDAAHAFPTSYQGRMVGTIGTITCFSFYATKSITTGEGGMILTDNDALAERCRIMALHGISRDGRERYTGEGSWQYEIVASGYKYNLTDIAAALGLAQLGRANSMHRRRTAIAAAYNSAFNECAELQPPFDRIGDQHAWHLYMLRLNLELLNIDRSQFIRELEARNIGASVHFIPLHIQPYYRNLYGYKPEDFPTAYGEYQRVLSLPIYSKMSAADIEDVIAAVLAIVEKHRTGTALLSATTN